MVGLYNHNILTNLPARRSPRLAEVTGEVRVGKGGRTKGIVL